ncbi:hypothetical protein [Nocardioides sp. URHA0020]|uniref:hypothetical protein n=1 Tax=Nocardioides sp. URHA0020 TaxID=1380392 RepID=UPI00048BB3C1|nr:hypothetical protein [Nocardioides sp. URHA0020]
MRRLRTRWGRRLVGGVAGFLGAELLLTLVDAGPDPLRLALLVATCTVLLGLVLDALDDAEPSWSVEVEEPSVRDSGETRMVRYVGLIEAHESSRAPDRALRDRLGVLADQVLQQRHGLRRDDPGAGVLLGPELSEMLDGPPRRLSRAEISHYLSTIEEL